MNSRLNKNGEIIEQIENEKKKKKSIKLIKIISIIIILIFSLLYYMRFIETNRIKVKEIKVVDKSLPTNFHGEKVVQFSDLHYMMSNDNKYLKKLVNEINNLEPDIVVFTGDLLDEKVKYTDDDLKILSDELSKINCNLKYYIKGNHDYFRDDVSKVFASANFIDLNNKYEYIYINDEKILINGIGSSLNNDAIISDSYLDDDVFMLSLVHEPDIFDEIVHYSPNVVLAGHTHNGQINIPYLKDLFMVPGGKKYNDSYYEFNDTKFYINSGIGTSIFKFRLFNPPTINFYRLVTY